MPSLIQRSFAAGEIAPALAARADQAKYQTGLKTCRNFRVRKEGGVENRPGTQFIAEQKSSAARGRLHKFVYNDAQTYLLIFENLVMRLVQLGAQIAVSAVAAYNGGSTYAEGDLVEYSGVNYYSRVSANIGNQPDVSPTQWHALTGSIYEIPTPYVTADLARLHFDQSGDVVTITHPSYDIHELRRTGTTAWTLKTVTLGPQQAAPTAPTNTGPGAGSAASWVVTAVNSETFEESLSTSATTSSAAPTSGSPITVNWTDASGAGEYNVYRATNGVYGFIGVAASGVAGFLDNGILPDATETPPQSRNPFSGSGNHPSTSGYWQQRHVYANTTNAIEKFWTSKSGSFKNFSISSPLQDDDAVTGIVAGDEVQEVRHILSLGKLVILTAGGGWVIQGDADGVLRPTAINPIQHIHNGAAWVNPMKVGNTAVYVDSLGSSVLDLRYELQSDGYSGRDLTVFSTHLFEGKALGNGTGGADYQKAPHSILWFVRDDGVLLGLTYLREHELWGWHWHDTDGYFEDVCCVPEGRETAVYVLVRRTINGVTKRYIERFYSRRVTDVAVDAKFVDSGLTYDGRNVGGTTMALSGGATWEHTETLTIEASASAFVAGDVGNAIIIWEDVVTDEGLETEVTTRHQIMVTITGYSSTTVVTGRANKTVPVILRTGARATWGKAVDDVTGLDHLEGKRLSILADGNVIANAVAEPFYTVSGGSVHLPRPYMVIHAGLRYASDFGTLDLETLNGETLADKKKLIKGVTLLVQESRGIFAGPDFDRSLDENGVDNGDHLVEFKQRETEDWGEPIALLTGKAEINIQASWKQTAGVCVRQRDPLPLTILAAVPYGEVEA